MKGVKKAIMSNTGRKRVNLNGAYSPLNQDVIIREDQTINAQSTIALILMILEKNPEARVIHLYSDNARYYKCNLLREFLAQYQEKIVWHYLPPYSPNLNLIERLWKYIRKDVINTFYYEKFNDFKDAIWKKIDNLVNEKDELASFIGTDFHLIKKGHFHFT